MGVKQIIIFGGKGTAVNIAEGIVDAQLNHNMPIEFLGFAFDDDSLGSTINGYPILCKTIEAWNKYKENPDVVFIFQMNHQNKMQERLDLIHSYGIPKERWYTFIHPLAYVAKSAEIGSGTVVFVGSAIHSNAKIGDHCTFSALTTVGHDTEIGEHVFTATHVCIGSSVNIGANVFFGQNTTVIGSVAIEENNLIGLGAVVVKNITETNKIFVGQPAKPIKDIK